MPRASAAAGASGAPEPMPAAMTAQLAELAAAPTPDGALKLVSWNVNGLRALLNKRGYLAAYLEAERPDVICLSETKVDDAVVASLGDLAPGYHAYHSHSQGKKGYSGTAIYSLSEPLEVRYGMGDEAHDGEGRLIALEFADFHLVHTYVPNSGQKLERLAYRTGEWDAALLAFLKALEETKPVVWCGDLNVAHEEIDIHNPKGNKKTAGFTPQERANFTALLGEGFVDTWRAAHPEEQQYSYWSYRFNARAQNKGWRLDYVVVSQALAPRVSDAFIRADVSGSDHVPVGVVLEGL